MKNSTCSHARRLSLMCAVLLGTLGACSDKPSANVELTDALSASKAMPDAWEAFNWLNQKEASILQKNRGLCPAGMEGFTSLQPGNGGCTPIAAVASIADHREVLLLRAIDAGHPEALKYSFVTPAGDSPAYEHIRRKAAKVTVAAVELTGRKQPAAETLAIAALIYAQGRYVVRDTQKAVGLYARAWAAGNAQAPNDAALALNSINDVRNAYLWSLRCTGECARGASVSLDHLQGRLSDAAARQAQKAASDLSVVELDTKEGS